MAKIEEDSRKLRLLEWLTTPESARTPKSQRQLATELGVTETTIRNWKRDDAFRAKWEKESKDLVGEPDKVQRVLEMLYKGALDTTETLAARTRAAHEFLAAVDGIKPPAVDMAKKSAAELSDAEIEAMLAEGAQREAERRGLA
jgi:predicted transcriptional regulator